MILGVPNDLNCAHVLASALRMGITTASTEFNAQFYCLYRDGFETCSQLDPAGESRTRVTSC